MTGGEGYQEAQIPKDMSAFSEEFEKWKDPNIIYHTCQSAAVH